MNQFTISEISKITEGKLYSSPNTSDEIITNIVTDSRTFFAGGNAVFFALTGPRNNGHNYIPQLMKRGIKNFVVSEKKWVNSKASFVFVKNTTEALQKLATFNRRKNLYPVMGITGSNGKTIVKEWLHDILSENFSIVRSPKSYNSQIGVPLSVLLMNKNYNLGIFEAGISEPGEMKKLTEIIKPEIGIFTNLGDAHQENFESYEQKTEEKLQLFKSSEKLIFSVDNQLYKKKITRFCEEHSVTPVSWSLQKNKNVFLSFSAEKKESYTKISAKIESKKYVFKIPFSDSSSIENACHCFAGIWALTQKPDLVLKRFEKLEPVAMRLEIKQGINNCLLINDYYNSDLNSFSIALSVLQQQAAKGHLQKTVILSDIQQTGIPKPDLYKQVNQLLLDWKIDNLIGIGPEITEYFEVFSVRKECYSNLIDFKKSFQKENLKDSVILIKGARKFTFEKISALLQQKTHQTVLEVNLNALVYNLNAFRKLLKPETKVMVMVKAFSYGTGDVEIAKMLQFQNVDYLAVAVADEGVQLRNAGIQTPIIVMNPEEHSFQNFIDYRLEPNIYSLELLQAFTKTVSQNALEEFPIHLKIDTGMNRLGFKTNSETQQAISTIKATRWLKVKSVFSHLAASDDPEMDDFTKTQISRFNEIARNISKQFSYNIDRHILNSAGIERFTKYQFEMVRLGIGLYGVSQTGLGLEHVGTLKSTVSQVKTVQKTETVGYNRKGKIEKTSKIAVVPLGYADGLDRKLSNKNGSAFVGGKLAPIIGNICMDMLMLDVTGIDVNAGDEVEFFGSNNTISEVAEKAGTIPYEVLTGISQRVKRIYLQE
ncbi:bifunctional UDP-N-acetylmuramoyl-tripeptide:D-alanyl-D-alanine ligase/alanine racemase [Maribellus maritimus]|uniref:bifunctional UDP-N-acetylmuramoyl-tripeptide:D-alanyl-D-alanine ligase/alanine racemase n=1 Tax=Maribellus maritimus TaxID=2870838 RepID=UPI001EEADC93|nr:bifunctional UDP-N-acetylmuramoyl-tripeptide:D-alanyl-D-alanine ligase/alanine racemase [Maribellus maritimus]MCG6186083.1 bifunctional UDP-N-acetylmuramoyl-tripeptide:D-alanyl-D-alanine ligase/alanine racemase [Maribellus maritimus]